jgi:hypothetical protein
MSNRFAHNNGALRSGQERPAAHGRQDSRLSPRPSELVAKQQERCCRFRPSATISSLRRSAGVIRNALQENKVDRG